MPIVKKKVVKPKKRTTSKPKNIDPYLAILISTHQQILDTIHRIKPNDKDIPLGGSLLNLIDMEMKTAWRIKQLEETKKS